MSGLIKYWFCFIASILSNQITSQSIGNYVSNGSFEDHYPCNGLNMINLCKSWRSIDSSLYSGVFYMNTCFGNVPFDQGNFQYPKTGNGFGTCGFLCLPPLCTSNSNRGYFRNRLKTHLIPNQTYCVKLYVNVTEASTYGINQIGAFFCDNSIDSITKVSVPLVFINPQINNITTNYLTDTINWLPITGTFVATGNERNLVIGNFKCDTCTGKTFLKLLTPQVIACDLNIDDVSCIPLNLTAYAGPDRSCKIGDSVYVGRERDFAIDPGCTWYQLPNMSAPIATASGIWVKPIITTTYVVKQVLDCSALKYDTVVVYPDLVGLVSSSVVENIYNIYPNPTSNKINFSYKKNLKSTFELSITNLLGQELFTQNNFKLEDEIDIQFLSKGIYYLKIESDSYKKIFKVMKE